MNKINFKNNSEPPINAENLNQMQDNIDNTLNEKANISNVPKFSRYKNVVNANSSITITWNDLGIYYNDTNAYIITIISGNQAVWRYFGVLFNGYSTSNTLSELISKGFTVTSDSTGITIKNNNTSYDTHFNLSLINLRNNN